MKYSDLIEFEPIESVVQLRDADAELDAVSLDRLVPLSTNFSPEEERTLRRELAGPSMPTFLPSWGPRVISTPSAPFAQARLQP